jgi:ATP-dependent Lhr-like helicase
VDPEYRLEGPRGTLEVIEQLAGFEAPAAAWEASILPSRIKNYRREWLDELALSGEIAWGRLWGSAATTLRTTPICVLPREALAGWTALSRAPEASGLGDAARRVHELLAQRGAMFSQELLRALQLDKDELESGLSELVARGLITADSFAGLRALMAPARRGPARGATAGRYSLLRYDAAEPLGVEEVARTLLRRNGVVLRRALARERQPYPYRDLLRVFRTLEARGEVRGGRFVAGFDGEQYALPEAVSLLRALRRRGPSEPVHVAAADPLNLRGILTPDERVSPLARKRVLVA